MAYPLQSKARRSPSALQFDHSHPSGSTLRNSPKGTDNVFYDIPSSPPPPTSPTLNGRLASPSSPTRSPRSRSPRPAPSAAGARNRSATPSEPTINDIDTFSGYCRTWYYKQDEEAGRLMTKMLSSFPASQRAPFSRIQASIRSAWHEHVSAQKTAEFLAVLSSTQPGGSLMPHSRAQPDGSMAKKERHRRFDRFIRAWCTNGLPGTIPCFQGLYGIMRLQQLPETLGGAGGNRIDWEIDDAVFMEAAGKDFMLEAIDVLKGVLGFEEAASARKSSVSLIPSGPFPSAPNLHGRSESQPLSPNKQPSSATPSLGRHRSSSDPFLDSPPAVHRGHPVTPFDAGALPEESVAPTLSQTRDLHFDEASMRIWTSPDLANPELMELIKLFPAFITRHPVPRFPITRAADVEEGFDDPKPIVCGTGTMSISNIARSDGWEGGWWRRFVSWLTNLLG